MFRLSIFVAVFSLSAACASPSDAGLTREEAREQSNKSDELDIDICLQEGWYGDGEVCDDFCLFPDPDCAGNEFCSDDDDCEEDTRCNAEEVCLLRCDEDGNCDEACAGFCVPAPPEEVVCGGPAELSCEEDQWCSYSDDGILQRAEVSGTCRDFPLLCTTVFAQVCGRDGMTYNNECNANRAGVDAIASGPCDAEDPPEAPPENA